MNPNEEIQLLQSLIDELLRGIQEVLQSGEILSDEFQMMLSQELEYTTNRLDQLRVENPVDSLTPSIPVEPNLDKGMASSNVHSFGYDPENQRLLVKFQGDYPEENGPVYGYGGVPEVIFDLFRKGAIPARTDGKNKWGSWWKGKVPSLGASLYTLIKEGGYPYQKLN